jgi:hypothetical protein
MALPQQGKDFLVIRVCEKASLSRPTHVRLSRLRTLLAFALLTAVTWASPLVARAQMQRNWCGTADQRELLKYHLLEIARAADSTYVAYTAIQALGRATTTRVEIIMDQSICERASRVYYRYKLGPLAPEGAAVGRFGDKYGVYGDVHAGEWTILAIFNSKFESLGSYGM